MPKRKDITLANLSPQQVKLLTAIRRKYHDEWGQWLEKLMWSFSDAEGRPKRGRVRLVKKIDELRGYVKMIGNLIDLLMSNRAISDRQMTELFGAIREVKGRIVEMLQVAEKDKKIQKDMDELQEETGISFEGMEETHKLASRQMKALGKAPRKEARFPVPEPLKQMGAGIGRGIETALLGPFAPLVEQATGTIKGFVREFKERKARKGASRLAAGLGGTPKEIQELESGLLREQRPSPFKRGAMPGGVDRGIPGREEPSRENAIARGMGGTAGVRAVSGSLFEFFDSLAFKAKWTKRLLEAVTGMSDEKFGEGKIPVADKGMSGIKGWFKTITAGAIGGSLVALKAKILALGKVVASFAAKFGWLLLLKGGEPEPVAKAHEEKTTKALAKGVRPPGVSPLMWDEDLLYQMRKARGVKAANPGAEIRVRAGELAPHQPTDIGIRLAAQDLYERGGITERQRDVAITEADSIRKFQMERAGVKKTPTVVPEETIGEVVQSVKVVEGEAQKKLSELLHQDNEELITSIKKMTAVYEKQKEIAIGESGEDSEYDIDPLLRSISEGGLF